MSKEMEQAQLTEYQGSCHCGGFKFSVKLPPIETAFACNCSICARNSYLWEFPATNKDLAIEAGEGYLKTYEFGKRTRVHKFCPKCGISVMAKQHVAREGRNIAINIRTIHNLDLEKLKIVSFDGWSIEPAYTPPAALDTLTAKEGFQIYSGNCHCGAVTYSVKSKPLNKTGPKVAACDCSICRRNGYLWIYPRYEDVFVQGEGGLTDYIFGERAIHRFCSNCGVSMFNKLQESKVDMLPINVRTLNGVDPKTLNIEKGYMPEIVFKED